ncbi:B3 domain-containing protein At2g33720 [Ziziphus jujuba]|uniref:B3 domain-containing protein At2g33720 n=1 Tax=Ziziphus jujuba TaxID=326968 RepID=A0A6P4A0F6_ZIZJJ|nr:B3 domain-containing protein At2g33720 [Ziziphus jujuba]
MENRLRNQEEKCADESSHYQISPPESSRCSTSITTLILSTEDLNLSLWFSTNNNNKRKLTTQNHPTLPKRKKFVSDSDYAMALNLWRMRNYSKQDMAEEDSLGVTTKLSVYDPWRMTKDLMSSDVGHLSRLMLKSHWAEKYFLPHLDIKQVESDDGVTIKVFDSDTHSEHDLAFKLWKSSNSYVLKKGWVKEFVKRRNLKTGDQIGMFCHVPLMDDPQSMLKIYFCVLKRAQSKQN